MDSNIKFATGQLEQGHACSALDTLGNTAASANTADQWRAVLKDILATNAKDRESSPQVPELTLVDRDDKGIPATRIGIAGQTGDGLRSLLEGYFVIGGQAKMMPHIGCVDNVIK